MKRIIALFIVAFLILLQTPIFVEDEPVKAGTSYYVKNGGNDAADGLSDANAWETMGKVNTEMPFSTGDEVYFKYGDRWTDASQLTITGFNGTAGDRAILGAYGDPANGLPTFHNNTHGIYSDFNQYLTIQDIRIENMTGKGIEFEDNPTVGSKDNNVINVTVQNCEIVDITSSFGIHMYDGYFSTIKNNELINTGGSYTSGNDCLQMRYCDHCLMENNTIIGGESTGHGFIVVRSSDYIIIKNNTCHGNNYLNSDDIGEILYTSSYVVVDNNIFYDNKGAGFKSHGGHESIFRNNILYDIDGYGLGGYIGSGSPHIENNMYYHNTLYNMGNNSNQDAGFLYTIHAGQSNEYRYNIVKNNIIHTSDKYGIYAVTVAGLEAQMHSNLWVDNIVYNSDDADVRYNATSYTIAQAESTYPEKFQNNSDADPEFADVGSYNFSLNSTSPAIDNAQWLTNCSGGGTGTVITLHDARYFHDGFGLITGDEITIDTDNVTILDVDYSNDQITITPSITWVDKDNVSLRYNGTAPDIGAVESGVALGEEWSNSAPVNSNPDPQNGNTSVSLTPALRITINDANGYNQSMNVTWYYNDSGVWYNFANNLSVGNGTYYQTLSNASAYSTEYEWSVNTSDNATTPLWDNDSYSFTTESDPGLTAQWVTYYGNDTGTNFTINTYNVIKVYINGSVTNVTIYMDANTGINYSASRTENLTYEDNGYNYTGMVNSSSTDLSTQNSSLFVSPADDGYFLALWNETNFKWDFWICGFVFADKYLHQYDVLLTKIRSSRDWTI